MPLPVDTGRGFSINYLGKNLYSTYNPSKNSEKLVDSLNVDEETLYIVPSPLLLYGIDSLLRKIPESSYVLGVEFDQKLMSITQQQKIPESTNLKIVRLDSRALLKITIEELGIWRFRRCHLVPLNQGYKLYKDDYDYLFNFASHMLSTFWRNRLTLNKLGKLWIKNIFSNIQNISGGTPDNEGKPVVVCGAGSTLEESTSILKKYRENLYIIAVDTALSALLKSGIRPDLIFALESQFYNLGDFYDSIGMNIDLLTDITGYPPVCRKLSGNTYFFSSVFLQNKLLNRLNTTYDMNLTIPPLGSVGVAAVFTAYKLFKTNIFLTGLDFSFVPGKSHCKGSPFSNAQLRTSNRLNPAGSFGIAMNRKLLKRVGKSPESTVVTDSVLESYAALLRDFISNKDTIFDLSQNGYPLGAKFIDEKKFKELLNKPTTRDNHNNSIHFCASMAQQFIMNEIQLLKKLIDLWVLFNDSHVEEIPSELMNALEDVDYIYIDFPDRLPHPRKEISFLTRAVISARSYTVFLNNLLN